MGREMTKVCAPDPNVVIQAGQFGGVELVRIGIYKRDMIPVKMAEYNIRSRLPQVSDFSPGPFSQYHLPGMRQALMSHVSKGKARIDKDMPLPGLHITA